MNDRCPAAWGLWLLALTPLVLAGCPDRDVHALAGLVEVEDYSLPAGAEVEVEGDLILRASGAIDVAGLLVAKKRRGQSITLEAGGPIRITGHVRAGSGERGQAGGAVALRSSGAHVTLGAGARVAAGDGADGWMDAQTRGRGQDGGGVLIVAPTGTMSLDGAASVRLGDGGTGADLYLQPDDFPEGWTSFQVPNAGGHGGGFAVTAAAVQGLRSDVRVSERGVEGADGGLLLQPGETYGVYERPPGFTGGVGGAPGGFYQGLAAGGRSNWPAGAVWPEVADAPQAGTTHTGAARSRGGGGGLQGMPGWPGADAFKYFKAAATADHAHDPPDGDPIRVEGSPGESPGDDGESVLVWGARGGSCTGLPTDSGTRYFDAGCTPGKGGEVVAIGGDGAAGAHPSQPGGDGGWAIAAGSRGGAGPGGLAGSGDLWARGGRGGAGGGDCAVLFAAAGGEGGAGGGAVAYGLGRVLLQDWNSTGPIHSLDGAGNMGSTTVVEGAGGDGGDGEEQPGDKGEPGPAFASPEGDVEHALPAEDGVLCEASEDDDSADDPEGEQACALTDGRGDTFDPAGFERGAFPPTRGAPSFDIDRVEVELGRSGGRGVLSAWANDPVPPEWHRGASAHLVLVDRAGRSGPPRGEDPSALDHGLRWYRVDLQGGGAVQVRDWDCATSRWVDGPPTEASFPDENLVLFFSVAGLPDLTGCGGPRSIGVGDVGFRMFTEELTADGGARSVDVVPDVSGGEFASWPLPSSTP